MTSKRQRTSKKVSIRKSFVTDKFTKLPSVLCSLFLNCLEDIDIFESCLFVNNHFKEICYRCYTIKQDMKACNMTYFQHANSIHVKYSCELRESIQKSKAELNIKIDKRLMEVDIKNRIIYGLGIVHESIDTINIKTPFLRVNAYPETRHFIGPEELDLSIRFHGKSSSLRGTDITQYTFPRQLRKLKIQSDFQYNSVIRYEPTENNSFDYNKFLRKFPKLTECILLFECIQMEPIIIPKNITRFGILAMHEKRKQVIDLSETDMFENLVLWRTAQNSKSRLTLIPPKSGKINNLIMMNVNLYHVWGFEKFTDIEKLVIFEDFSSTDSIHSYENGAMLNILANTTANIKNIILVDMCLRTGNQTLRINPITKYITIQRCNLLYKKLIGEGLKHVFFSIQPSHEKCIKLYNLHSFSLLFVGYPFILVSNGVLFAFILRRNSSNVLLSYEILLFLMDFVSAFPLFPLLDFLSW